MALGHSSSSCRRRLREIETCPPLPRASPPISTPSFSQHSLLASAIAPLGSSPPPTFKRPTSFAAPSTSNHPRVNHPPNFNCSHREMLQSQQTSYAHHIASSSSSLNNHQAYRTSSQRFKRDRSPSTTDKQPWRRTSSTSVLAVAENRQPPVSTSSPHRPPPPSPNRPSSHPSFASRSTQPPSPTTTFSHQQAPSSTDCRPLHPPARRHPPPIPPSPYAVAIDSSPDIFEEIQRLKRSLLELFLLDTHPQLSLLHNWRQIGTRTGNGIPKGSLAITSSSHFLPKTLFAGSANRL